MVPTSIRQFCLSAFWPGLHTTLLGKRVREGEFVCQSLPIEFVEKAFAHSSWVWQMHEKGSNHADSETEFVWLLWFRGLRSLNRNLTRTVLPQSALKMRIRLARKIYRTHNEEMNPRNQVVPFNSPEPIAQDK